jgi:hypothetical protein
MLKTNSQKFDNLERKLTDSRLKLQTLWNQYGVTNAEVLAASIEFDELLNQYQKTAVIDEKPV